MASIDPNQHCTYPNQDGEDDYSFSHTAGYCGKEQPRRCGCAFCYPEEVGNPNARLARAMWELDYEEGVTLMQWEEVEDAYLEAAERLADRAGLVLDA